MSVKLVILKIMCDLVSYFKLILLYLIQIKLTPGFSLAIISMLSFALRQAIISNV